MRPGVGLLDGVPRGVWRVVHRLHAPACPYSQVFGGWTVLRRPMLREVVERRA